MQTAGRSLGLLRTSSRERPALRARVTTVNAAPGKLDEFIKVYTESPVPVAKQQKGFEGTLLLTDPDIGTTIVISLWASAEDMTAGENSGYYKAQIDSRKHLFAGTPVREYFNVSARA